MSSTQHSHDAHTADVKLLHSMGYAQELHRGMGAFSNFAISFSIICILSGGINSLAQATSGAGGAAIGIGWPDRMFHLLCICDCDGADFVCLPHCWRSVSLGLNPWESLHWRGHSVV